MQKDYWSISKSNFRALGVLSLVIVVLVLLTVINTPSSPNIIMISPVVGGIALLSCILFFILGILFKNYSPKAIIISYIYLGFTLVVSVIRNFIMSSPLDGILFKILGLLVLYYVFINVYKASKQTI